MRSSLAAWLIEHRLPPRARDRHVDPTAHRSGHLIDYELGFLDAALFTMGMMGREPMAENFEFALRELDRYERVIDPTGLLTLQHWAASAPHDPNRSTCLRFKAAAPFAPSPCRGPPSGALQSAWRRKLWVPKINKVQAGVQLLLSLKAFGLFVLTAVAEILGCNLP